MSMFRSSLVPSADRRRPLAACTIISRNYLAQAKVLADSFRRHEPSGRFYLLVVDRLPEGTDLGPGIEVIDPDGLGLGSKFYELCFKYNVIELNTAVKPSLLLKLLEHEPEIVYLDPDIMIGRPLDELRDAFDAGDIVLTPHILSPIPLDGKHPSDQDILVSGAFNLGFIGVRRSEQGIAMLKWWEERLEDLCRIDVAHGLFTDQRWIDLVPGMFPRTVALRDDTYNVAFWNLHERTISRDADGAFIINGRPLAFYHFSGFNPNKPLTLSKHQDRTQPVAGTPLGDLLALYTSLQLEAGFDVSSQWEYGYSRFDNAVVVNNILRQLYLGMPPADRAAFANPFATAAEDSFLNWATRASMDGNLSRFLRELHRLRWDLVAAFPDARGKDRQRFIEWATKQGPLEMGYEPSLVQDAPAVQGTYADEPARPLPAPPPEELKRIHYLQMVQRIRTAVDQTLPADAEVLVISKGDELLLSLGATRRGRHFPQNSDGIYAGYAPPDSGSAVAHLEQLQATGATHLMLPGTSAWWLDHYAVFADHLKRTAREVWRDDDVVLFELGSAETIELALDATGAGDDRD